MSIPEQIEERDIKEKKEIEIFMDKYFWNNPIHMMFEGKTYPIKPINYTQKGLIIRLSPRKDKEKRIISLTAEGKIFIFIFSLKNKDNLYELLEPVQLSIRVAKRTEERIKLKPVSGFQPFVTGIANQNEIIKNIQNDRIKVDAIIKENLPRFQSLYEYVEIHMGEAPDERFRLLNEFECPIFIPDISKPELTPPGFVPYYNIMQLYKNKMNEKFISEISILIKFKNFFPIGYILTKQTTKININSLNLIYLLCTNFKKDFFSAGIISESREKCEILDINTSGISFTHSQMKNFGKIFSIGAVILFDMYLEEKYPQQMRAVVKYIKPQEKNFKIGCEFFLDSRENLSYLEEYLEKQKSISA